MLALLSFDDGDKGELTAGCELEYLRFPRLSAEGCERLANRACLVESVIESVETEVTEPCRALPLTDEDDMLVPSVLYAVF